MTITESAEFDGAFPSRRFSSVELQLKDGRGLYSGPTEAPGNPEVPASTAQIRAKFQRYADAQLGAVRAAYRSSREKASRWFGLKVAI